MTVNPAPNPGPGTVYTETLVHAPGVPYQLAIIELETGRRLTSRIEGQRATIGDPVEFIEFRNEVPFFRKTT